MIKSWKLWTVLGVLGLVLSSVGVGTFWSYLKTGHKLFGETLKGTVPLDFEITRLVWEG